MFKRIFVILLFIAILICGYGLITIRPELPDEIIPSFEEEPAESAEEAAEEAPAGDPTPTPPPPPTPTPGAFLTDFSTGPPVIRDPSGATFIVEANGALIPTRRLPRHGLLIAFVLPLVVFGIPWLILEFFIVRYVQPRGLDLTTVLVKAKDGLFISAVVSMTARRTLTMASSRASWSRVRDFVEKAVEQELIHEAIQFSTLEELEQNLKLITQNLHKLPVVEEMSRDFGIEVLRFNIEMRYTPETREALQRKADASAGGIAYLAYAAAAHLDPDREESRELYRIFQETTSRVDAARNLGGGISEFLASLNRKDKEEGPADEKSDDD